MNEQKTPSKKISIGFILSWIFGVLFAFTGIVSVFSEPIPGLVMLILAVVLLPPVTKLIDQKWKLHLSTGVKAVVIIIGFAIFGATVDTSDTPIAQQNEQQNVETQPAQNENVTGETIIADQPSEEQPQATNDKQVTDEQKTETILTSDDEKAEIPENEPTPAPSETVSQRNAVAKAKSYLSFAGFSRDGLIEQLEYDQFSHADAVYGADNSGANWTEQAAIKAQSYMEFSAFSRGGLIEQLEYDGFTRAQAEYGADSVGL